MSNKLPLAIDRDSPMEKAISAALEQQTTPTIPLDFAARVAAKASTLPKRAAKPQARYARAVSILLSALLILALFLIAPHAQPTFASLPFDLELTATALLAGLAYWLTRTTRESL